MSEPSAPVEKKSLFSLLAGVFVRPGATFAHLREHPSRSWWLPAVLIVVCTLLPLLVTNAVANRSAGPTMNGGMTPVEGSLPAEEPTGPSAMDVLKTVGTIVSQPLTWLLWGGALYLASVFLGRSSGFKPMFQLAVWAWLPYAVRGLVQTVYIWITGQAILNKGFAGYVIDSSTSQIITPGPEKLALASILGRVDGFMVWNLALLVIGLMAFTKLPRRKAIIAVGVIWLVFALLSVVPAILGGMFSSLTM
ncbi:MAG: Yip1 domain protein [Chloroflexi bacterium ADurb.Bin222]|nr:MAG: Yip1 domain protein [Chloroflexi bacterium ADurb.Bin222]